MSPNRRLFAAFRATSLFLSWVGAGLVASFVTGCAPRGGDADSAQANYPTKAINLICPWSPGGGTDRLARFVADRMQEALGQPVIVVNRTGGSGAVGHSAGALARPDGYTVTMSTFELSTMHYMGITDLTWEQFEPVVQLNSDAAGIVVRKDSPWNNLTELLNHVRENPGAAKISGTATGGVWDLARAGLLLKASLPVDSMLWVPAQGAAPAIVELLGGHIDVVCCSVAEAVPQLEAGELKLIGVMAPERHESFSDVPTAAEQGIDWEMAAWRGLMVPKGTPRPIVDRLYQAGQEIAQSEAFREFMKKNGFAIKVRNPDEFSEYLGSNDEGWRQVIVAAGYASE